MSFGLALTLLLAAPQDWPTQRADAQRSGGTAESLDAPRLRPAWEHVADAPPRPAWPGPARWDAFSGLRGLPSMREYDPCFHPVAVGDRVWYASTADDAVHCLDATTGRRRWRFVTGGPIRVAPTWSEGRLYFGSDDGFAYCVDAEDGTLQWKWSPAPTSAQVLHDGNPISFWPVRTGVLVDGGLAYFGASMLPWKESVLCAVDARTGAAPPLLADPAFERQKDGWQSVPVPADWAAIGGGALAEVDGFAWYRCAVQVPPGSAPIVLELGRVDDCDRTFFNGVEVGGAGHLPPEEFVSAWNQPRRYEIPPELVRESDWNLLAVRVFDGAGGGGLIGPSLQLSRGPVSLPLSGSWQMRLGDSPRFAEVPPDLGARVEAGEFADARFPPLQRVPQPFQRRFREQTMEGPILLSDRQVVVPQGRVAPLLYRRADGRAEGGLEGGGGVFVLLTDDHHVLHGPGNKTGWITESSGRTRAKLASFDRGHALVVSGHWAFLLGERSLSAIDRTERKVVWQRAVDEPFSMILAGPHLYLGGEDRVSAYEARTGTPSWTAPVRGRAQGLCVARGALIVSTDEGHLHCFRVDPEAEPLALESGRRAELPRSPGVRQSARIEGLLGRWVFHRSTMQDAAGEVPTQTRVAGVRVRDLAGRSDASLPGPAEIERHGELEAVVLDGQFSLNAAEDFRAAAHPIRDFSAEAWVRVDAAQEWGGFVGMCQDNGAHERGWLLGYRQNRFAMTLSSAGDGDGRNTCLRAHADFEPGTWHHVVGTYDGHTMRLYVDGAFSAESAVEEGDILYPDAAFYELGAYRDQDEFFPIRGALHEVRVYERALPEREVRARFEEKREHFPVAIAALRGSHSLAAGPWLRFLGGGRAAVEWNTVDPVPTLLRWGLDEEQHELRDPGPRREHRAVIEGLRRRRVVHYQVGDVVEGETVFTDSYECDTFFDWTELPGAELAQGAPPPTPRASARPAAPGLLRALPEQGSILLLASARAPMPAQVRRAWEVAMATRARVVLGFVDEAAVDPARTLLADTGLYGTRLRARHCPEDLPGLGLPLGVFDAVLVPALRQVGAAAFHEAAALVRPEGVLLVESEADSAPLPAPPPGWPAFERLDLAGDESLARGVRPEDEGAGEWTHLYADSDNSAFGGEHLGGARQVDELEVKWLGQPGPRYQSDRQNRKPSPLCAGGRLYLQGLHRILALRAHNGSILWSLELPRMARFNVTRDCSNWCADADSLYLALGEECWRIDGETGRIEARLRPPVGETGATEWGYIARSGDLLLGSSRPAGTAFTTWWGSEHWYDQKEGEAAAKAASDALFALDADSGRPRWQAVGGLILEATITVHGDRVSWVETRDPASLESPSRRLFQASMWEHLWLVQRDLRDGSRRWERRISPPAGLTALYLVASGDALVLSSSAAGSFHVARHDADSGAPVWATDQPWETDHHGKHLSHPAVHDGQIYLRPHVLDLATGAVVRSGFPVGHTCSSYVLTQDSLFLRAGSITMWTPETQQISRWSRLRPDCWISTIPAAGLLLSPEGGGGCSCGSWLETSLAFRPRAARPAAAREGSGERP